MACKSFISFNFGYIYKIFIDYEVSIHYSFAWMNVIFFLIMKVMYAKKPRFGEGRQITKKKTVKNLSSEIPPRNSGVLLFEFWSEFVNNYLPNSYGDLKNT